MRDGNRNKSGEEGGEDRSGKNEKEKRKQKERKGAHLDGLHAGVLGNVLILIQAILGRLPFPQADAELDKEDHDGLKRGNGRVAGALGGDMVVQKLESTEVFLDGHEFLGALQPG